VMQAMLQRVPDGTLVRTLVEHPEEVDALSSQPAGGYLVVPEVSEAPVPGYIWGDPVRRVFGLLKGGYSLATALHAPGLQAAFQVLTEGNEIPDEDVGQIQLMVYIRTLGEDWQNPTRRAVAEVHEIEGVSGGLPIARLLHRWDEESDRFEQVAAPAQLDDGGTSLEDLARELQREAEKRAAAG